MAFVRVVFTLAESDLNFYASAFEVDAQGDKGHSFFVDFASDTDDFVFVHKKFARSFGFVIESIALFVGRYVGVLEEHLVFLDIDVAVFQDQVSSPKRFDFGSLERNTGFVGVDDFVVVIRAFIFGYQ